MKNDVTRFEEIKNYLLKNRYISIIVFLCFLIWTMSKFGGDVINVFEKVNSLSKTKSISFEIANEKLRPIYFRSRSHQLTTENRKILNSYIKILEEIEFDSIVITGHTDMLDPASNRNLSMLRALSVSKHLQNNGIPGHKIHVIGFGGEKTMKEKRNPYNKRVEFKLQN